MSAREPDVEKREEEKLKKSLLDFLSLPLRFDALSLEAPFPWPQSSQSLILSRPCQKKASSSLESAAKNPTEIVKKEPKIAPK
jgi:hypothetical protein